MEEIAKLLIEVFGPAAVTLILLLAAINKMWPQLIEDQAQTRQANMALIEAIGKIVTQQTQAISELEERLSEDHRRFERTMDQRANQLTRQHEEYLRALDQINRSLEGIAGRLNGE